MGNDQKNRLNSKSRVPNYECDKLIYNLSSPPKCPEKQNFHFQMLKSEKFSRKRVILKNGDCNILHLQLSNRLYRFIQDLFTTLVDSRWRWTLLCFALGFVLSWLGFASIWWLIVYNHGDLSDPNSLPPHIRSNWTSCVTNIYSFTSAILFSLETQQTIGYGSRYVTEECPEAVFLICFQSIIGVMIQTLMVGIFFAKASRPKRRARTLLFSKNAVINVRDGELCLMFRVGDLRKSHIISASIRAQLIRSKVTREGEFLFMHQEELVVGTDGSNNNIFFIWPLTIIHKIDQKSPFYDMTQQQMNLANFELVVILEGTIESTGQTTQARSSYLPQEILWGHQFENMVKYSEKMLRFEVDYTIFDRTREIPTPSYSARSFREIYLKGGVNEEKKLCNRKQNTHSGLEVSDHNNRNRADNFNDYIRASEGQYSQCFIDVQNINEIRKNGFRELQ